MGFAVVRVRMALMVDRTVGFIVAVMDKGEKAMAWVMVLVLRYLPEERIWMTVVGVCGKISIRIYFANLIVNGKWR